MKEYNELINKIQLLCNTNNERCLTILSTIAGLMNQLDGNLKAAKYRETFRYEQLRITIVFGEYYDA